MANTRRTKAPHPGPWETPDLATDPPTWLAPWAPGIRNKVSSRLSNALTKPNVVRVVRSTLSEWSVENEWHCYRFLGAGAFGTAAVWQQKNADGILLDEIVLKEDRQRGQFKYKKNSYPVILDEANAMRALNRVSNSGNLVHMRGYKVFIKKPLLSKKSAAQLKKQGLAPIHNEFHRYYLEYAPYGTINNLALRYKSFNRYLPELFLWHVFHSLATAAVVMETLSDENEAYVHLDLKPDNIFLGYEDGKSREPNATGGLDGEDVMYPTIKLGDFGIAHKVNTAGNQELQMVGNAGTAYHKAPEIIRDEDEQHEFPDQYGSWWDRRPFQATDSLTSKADIWAIGKVMFDLFSLAPSGHFNHIMAKNGATYEQQNKNKMIDCFYWTPFSQDELDDKSPYTLALSTLIERCMHADPDRRPTPQELLEATRVAMDDVYGDVESTLPYSVRNRKLYYQGNEINDMTIRERNCGRWLNPAEWSSLHAPGNNDPDAPSLDIYPELMWEMRRTKEHQEAVAKEFRDHGDEEESDGAKFRNYLLHDTSRIRRGSAEIEIIDVDKELTLDGTLDQDGFLARYETARRPPGVGGQAGGHDGNNNDDDDDDGNNDDNDNPGGGGPVQAAGATAAPPVKSGPAQAAPRKQPARRAKNAGGGQKKALDGVNLPAEEERKQAPKQQHVRQKQMTASGQKEAAHDEKHIAAPRSSLHGIRSYVLGQSGSSRYQAAKYEPYVMIEAHAERFATTRDGKGLIFVVDTAPYPDYKIPETPSPRALRTGEESHSSRASVASSGFDDGKFRPRVRSVFVPALDDKALGSRKRRRSSDLFDEAMDLHRPRKTGRQT